SVIAVAHDSSGVLRRGVQVAEASTDTPWVSPDRPHPTARYGSYGAAADTVRAIIRRALGAWADSARWTRGREPFLYRDSVHLNRSTQGRYFWSIDDRDTQVTVATVHMKFVSHSGDAPGSSAIEQALTRAGWDRDGVYDADGPDGTHFVLVSHEALCDVV